MSLKRVVISGIGTINPLGNNIEEFFSNLDKGVSSAGPIDIFDTTLFKTKFACQVKGYHPGNFGLDRKEYRKLDRYSQFALIATDEAIKDSSLDLESVDKSRVGVVLGTGIGGIETFGDELRDFSAGDGTPRFSPYYILKVIANIAKETGMTKELSTSDSKWDGVSFGAGANIKKIKLGISYSKLHVSSNSLLFNVSYTL